MALSRRSRRDDCHRSVLNVVTQLSQFIGHDVIRRFLFLRHFVLEIFGIYFARAQRVLRARAPSPLEGRGGEDMQDQLYGKAINSLRVRVL